MIGKWSQLLMSALVMGLLGVTSAWAGDAAQDVQIAAPYVRAVPPGTPNSGGFMVFKNNGSVAHAVVAGRANVSQRLELHTHKMEGGMMKMRQVEKIEIPAGGETVLKPGGLHVMFIGLNGDLKVGQEVGFTLIFEDGSETTVTAPVKTVMQGMQMGKDKMSGHKM